MRRSRAAVTAALCVSAALAAAGTATADTLVAMSPCPQQGPASIVSANGCTGVSAHAGRLVWSAFDAATGHYALMTASSGGVTEVSVAQRARPFDVDLGEDGGGRVVAVYSRCAADPLGPPAGCDVREIGFTAGAAEHALLPGVSDGDPLLPSRWHEHVAIARRTPAGVRTARLCSATGAPRCRLLPGGPTGKSPRVAGPRSIDIDARRIAMGWFWDATGTVRRHAILVSSFSAAAATEIARAGAGYAGNAAVHSAVLDGGYVYYARGGGSCDYTSPPNAIGRYDLARHTVEEVTTPELAGLTVDAGRTFYAACTLFPPPGVPGATRIAAADPPPFGRPGALRPDRAARCPAARTPAGWAAQTIGQPGRSPRRVGLAADSDGAAIALWPGRRALTYATRAPRRRFGLQRTVAAAVGPFDLSFASDGAGHAVAGWVRSSDGGATVTATTATVRGHFTAPRRLDGDSSSPDRFGLPEVAMAPDGGAVAAWAVPPAAAGGIGSVLVAFRPLGSARFGDRVPVATGVTRTRLLSVAAGSGGRALVVLSGYFEPQVDIVDVRAAGAGARRTLTGTGGAPTLGAATVGGDGAATVVWSNNASTQVATRPAGGEFSPVTRISTPAQPVGAPSLAVHGGRVAIAWSERDVRASVARMQVAQGRLGAALAPPRAFAAVRGRIGEAQVALGARGAAALVWQLSCSTSGRVLLATQRSRSAGFGAQTVISGRDLHVQAPTVALGRAGRPIVAWVAGSRPIGNSRVRVATADG